LYNFSEKLKKRFEKLMKRFFATLREKRERYRGNRNYQYADRNHLLEDFVILHIFASEKEKNN